MDCDLKFLFVFTGCICSPHGVLKGFDPTPTMTKAKNKHSIYLTFVLLTEYTLQQTFFFPRILPKSFWKNGSATKYSKYYKETPLVPETIL